MTTDEVVSLSDLKKGYFNFLLTVFNTNLTNVFIDERNRLHFPNILQSVISCSSEIQDPALPKFCFNILVKMIEEWAVDLDVISDPFGFFAGFYQCIYEQIVPIGFNTIRCTDFNINDGQSIIILNEIATLLKTIYNKQGHRLCDFLANVYLPSLGYPSLVAQVSLI